MKKLTDYRVKSLEFYLAHKDKRVTLLSMFVFNIRIYIWIGILFPGIILFYYFVGGIQSAFIVGALFVGVILRDIGTFRRCIRNWPLLQEIIDWDKAGMLAEVNKNVISKS